MAGGGTGTKDDPWELETPPGGSGFQMWKDESGDEPVLVCQVGSTQLKYRWRVVDDAVAMLQDHGDWMPLGNADEQKPAPAGSLEAWARDESNPVGGWYGLKKGYRGRVGNYVSPLLERLGLVELTHDARNNRLRVL